MYCRSAPKLKPRDVFDTLSSGAVTVGVGSVTVSDVIVCCFVEKIVGPANTPTSVLFATGTIQMTSRWTTFSVCLAPLCEDVTDRGLSVNAGSGMLPLMLT